MRKLLLFCLLICHASGYAQSGQLRADKSKSFIRYGMKHALHSWTGESKDLNCVAEIDADGRIVKVAATVKVRSFDSKNSNRDAHMLEVTDDLTYPNISFYTTSIIPTDKAYRVKGIISFHGVEKSVEMEVQENKSSKGRTINAEFTLLLEDFKIERPSLFMVKTDNELKITLQAVF
jgi:polyisoprenoid-binding protein YceI